MKYTFKQIKRALKFADLHIEDDALKQCLKNSKNSSPKYKEGDKVTIIDNINGHAFDTGEKVCITAYLGVDGEYKTNIYEAYSVTDCDQLDWEVLETEIAAENEFEQYCICGYPATKKIMQVPGTELYDHFNAIFKSYDKK